MKFISTETDERIIALQKKYGFETLYVVTGLLAIYYIYKILYLDKTFSQCLDIYLLIVIPWFYYTIRGIIGGAVNFKTNFSSIGNFIATLLSICIIIVPTIIGMLKEPYIQEAISHFSFILGFVTGLLLVFVLMFVISKISKRINGRYDD